jgi:hypothetical protein
MTIILLERLGHTIFGQQYTNFNLKVTKSPTADAAFDQKLLIRKTPKLTKLNELGHEKMCL